MSAYFGMEGKDAGARAEHSLFFDNGDKNKRQVQESVTLKNRSELFLSGVVQVRSFDEQAILLETRDKLIHIRGKGLKIDRILKETEEVLILGEIDSFVYTDIHGGSRQGKGLLARMFQ